MAQASSGLHLIHPSRSGDNDSGRLPFACTVHQPRDRDLQRQSGRQLRTRTFATHTCILDHLSRTIPGKMRLNTVAAVSTDLNIDSIFFLVFFLFSFFLFFFCNRLSSLLPPFNSMTSNLLPRRTILTLGRRQRVRVRVRVRLLLLLLLLLGSSRSKRRNAVHRW